MAVTVTLDKTDGALAFQISEVPACALTRCTKVQLSPAPVTVRVWPPETGPSEATNAMSHSPATAVLNDAVVRVPFPSEKTTLSVARVAAERAAGWTAPRPATKRIGAMTRRLMFVS